MIIKINRRLPLNTQLKYHQYMNSINKILNTINYNLFKYKNFIDKNMISYYLKNILYLLYSLKIKKKF